MKIKQICRTRVGGQEADAGYRISAKSNGVTDSNESFFMAMEGEYFQQAEVDNLCMSVIDLCGSDSETYITSTCPKFDNMGRRTAFSHGFILQNKDYMEILQEPGLIADLDTEIFLKEQPENTALEEISEIIPAGSSPVKAQTLTEKFNIDSTDDKFRNLIATVIAALINKRQMYVGLDITEENNGEKGLSFIAMLLSFFPKTLRKRVTFSTYYIPSNPQRLINLMPSSSLVRDRAFWFDFETGEYRCSDIDSFRYGIIDIICREKDDDARKAILNQVEKFITESADTQDFATLHLLYQIAEYYIGLKNKIEAVYDKVKQSGKITLLIDNINRLDIKNRKYIDEVLTELIQICIETGAKGDSKLMTHLLDTIVSKETEEVFKDAVFDLMLHCEEDVRHEIFAYISEKYEFSRVEAIWLALIDSMEHIGEREYEQLIKYAFDKNNKEIFDVYKEKLTDSVLDSKKEAAMIISRYPAHEYTYDAVNEFLDSVIQNAEIVDKELMHLLINWTDRYGRQETAEKIAEYIVSVYLKNSSSDRNEVLTYVKKTGQKDLYDKITVSLDKKDPEALNTYLAASYNITNKEEIIETLGECCRYEQCSGAKEKALQSFKEYIRNSTGSVKEADLPKYFCRVYDEWKYKTGEEAFWQDIDLLIKESFWNCMAQKGSYSEEDSYFYNKLFTDDEVSRLYEEFDGYVRRYLRNKEVIRYRNTVTFSKYNSDIERFMQMFQDSRLFKSAEEKQKIQGLIRQCYGNLEADEYYFDLLLVAFYNFKKKSFDKGKFIKMLKMMEGKDREVAVELPSNWKDLSVFARMFYEEMSEVDNAIWQFKRSKSSDKKSSGKGIGIFRKKKPY